MPLVERNPHQKIAPHQRLVTNCTNKRLAF